jgi:hypothetical protein
MYIPKKNQLINERRTRERKDFAYYMQVIDNGTQELVGHLVDIGSGGFKLDSQTPILVNQDFRFRLNLTSEMADQPSIVFLARSKWCRVDPLDPFIYNVGFQLINISAGCCEIFNRMIEKYGRTHEDRPIDLRRSNLW